MYFFAFVGDDGVAEKAPTVAVFEYYFWPIFKVPSFCDGENAVEVEITVGPLCRRSLIYKAIFNEIFVTLLYRGCCCVFEAPSKVYLFPKDKKFVGYDIYVKGIGGVEVDSVGGAIKAHGTIFGGELLLVEHVDGQGKVKEEEEEGGEEIFLMVHN